MTLLQSHVRTVSFVSPSIRRAVRPSKHRVCAEAPTLPSWQDITKEAGRNLGSYTLLPRGSQPATVPSPVLPTSLDSVWSAGTSDTKAVLLIRDTNAWCPFCEMVWLALEYKGIHYDTMLIDLRKKPDWYEELVPTKLVPACKINGNLVYESYDILKKLEEEFPEPPLWPKEGPLKEEATEIVNSSTDFSGTGYRFLAGGRLGTTETTAPESSGQELKDAFVAELDRLEELLSKHTEGPFFMGEQFTLADIMYAPSLERFGANLPVVRGLHLKNNPAYPRLNAWYQAMDELPSYQKVKSDDATLILLLRKLFGVTGVAPDEPDERRAEARREAAAKLAANHESILNDILKNSGILRVRTSQYGGTVAAVNGYPSGPGIALTSAVDHALLRVGHFLLKGTPGPRNDCKEACAIGSAALVFFRNRASSPRDLSAAAAEELRNACSTVLFDMF